MLSYCRYKIIDLIYEMVYKSLQYIFIKIMKIYRYLVTFIIPFFMLKKAFSEVIKKDTYYFPYVSGSISIEEKYDKLLDGNDGAVDDKKNFLFTNINTKLNLNFSNNFLLGTRILLRPTSKRINDIKSVYNDSYGNESALKRDLYFFKSYGFIFEEVFIEYKEEYFRAGIGKFNPNFGLAYKNDRYYGIFGQNIVDQYKLSEVLGIFVVMQLPMLNLRLDLFNKDRTFLSSSLFGLRNSYEADYSIGSTKDFLNFSFSSDFLIKENIRMNFAYKNLRPKSYDFKKNESSFLAGVEYIVEEGQFNLGYAASAEAVYVNNYNGDMGRYVGFITANLPFFYSGWNFGINYSLKMDFKESFDTAYSQLFGANIGYIFKNGIMLDFARKFEREVYKTSKFTKEKFNLSSWGIRLSYRLKF